MRCELIREFYEENRQGLYTYALSLTRCSATAEDAVHSVICKLLSRPVLPRELKPYAYRCVRNLIVDEWRKNASRSESIIDIENLEVSEADKLSHLDLDGVLQRIGSDEREIIVLKAIDGLTFKEIAAVCNTSINTVASRYRRGLDKLRDMLAEDSDE